MLDIPVHTTQESEDVDHRSERHEIYASLASHLGERVANNLMSLLPPVGWADVATKHDLAGQLAVTDARFDAVDARFDAVDARFTSVEARLGVVDASLLDLNRGLRTLTALMVSLFGLTLASIGTATGILLHALAP